MWNDYIVCVIFGCSTENLLHPVEAMDEKCCQLEQMLYVWDCYVKVLMEQLSDLFKDILNGT